MDFRGNFHALMRGDVDAWLPFDLPASPPIQDVCERETGTRDLNAAFGADFGWTGPAFGADPAAWREAYDHLGFAWPEDPILDGTWGLVWSKPDRSTLGEAWHLTEMVHPLAGDVSEGQVAALPWPTIDERTLADGLRPEIERIHRTGRAAAVMAECTVFEFVWYLRGMDDVFLDLAEGAGPTSYLLDLMTCRSAAVAEAAGSAGADLLCLGDDVGTQRGMMMDPALWRRELKPRLAHVVRVAKLAGVPWVRYHSDGDIAAIVPDLVEIGIDILNPIQPECMDWRALAAEYGRDLALFGMIGTQTTMPYGTAADVQRAVADLWEGRRAGHRLIAAPTHVLEPDVPWDNVRAFVDAVKGNAEPKPTAPSGPPHRPY